MPRRAAVGGVPVVTAAERQPTAAAALRSAFDDSFAVAASPPTAPDEAVLAIRVGPYSYAVRASSVAGLHVDIKLAPVPSRVPELLGVASLRGVIVAVYDLALLLGHARAATPRWIALAPGPAPIGLAFDVFEGQVPVSRDAFTGDDSQSAAGEEVQEAVRLGGHVRSVIQVPALLAAIVRRALAATSSKER